MLRIGIKSIINKSSKICSTNSKLIGCQTINHNQNCHNQNRNRNNVRFYSASSSSYVMIDNDKIDSTVIPPIQDVSLINLSDGSLINESIVNVVEGSELGYWPTHLVMQLVENVHIHAG